MLKLQRHGRAGGRQRAGVAVRHGSANGSTNRCPILNACTTRWRTAGGARAASGASAHHARSRRPQGSLSSRRRSRCWIEPQSSPPELHTAPAAAACRAARLQRCLPCGETSCWAAPHHQPSKRTEAGPPASHHPACCPAALHAFAGDAPGGISARSTSSAIPVLAVSARPAGNLCAHREPLGQTARSQRA